MRNQKEKFELKKKKVGRKFCVRDITFLTARPPYYLIFVWIFSSTPSLSSTPILRRKIFFCSRKLPPVSTVLHLLQLLRQLLYLLNWYCSQIYHLWTLEKSSEVLCKNDVLKNFKKFTREHLHQNKIAGLSLQLH